MEQLTMATQEDLKKVISSIVKTELASVSQAGREELLTRKGTAKVLGISLHTLNEFTKSGKIPAYRIGTRVRYKVNEVFQSLNRIPTTN